MSKHWKNRQKKRAELVHLLGGSEIQLSALSDFPNVSEADETGATFAENAEIKATEYASQLNEWVLAEDSGLSVPALNGAPGIPLGAIAQVKPCF